MSVDTLNATAGVDPTRAKIAGSIKQAAATTGALFESLPTPSKREYNSNPNPAAPTSSAGGRFKFTTQPWLGTGKDAGGQPGYEKYANPIIGTAVVKNKP